MKRLKVLAIWALSVALLLALFALLPNQAMHPGRHSEYEAVYKTYVKTHVPLARPGGLTSWPNSDIEPVVPHQYGDFPAVPSTSINGNLLSNGGFDLWRLNSTLQIPINNTHFTGPTGWQLYSSVPGISASESSSSPLSVTPNALKFVNSIASTIPGNLLLSQVLPPKLTKQLVNKTVTVSFYSSYLATPDSQKSVNIGLEICTSPVGNQNNLIAGFLNNSCVMKNYPLLQASWHRFSSQLKIPRNTKSIGMSVSVHGLSGSVPNVRITGIQMELGSTASAFRPREGSAVVANLGIGGAADDPGIYLMPIVFSKVGISDPNLAMKLTVGVLGVVPLLLIFFFYLRKLRIRNPWCFLPLVALIPGVLLSRHFIPLGSQYLIQQSRDALPVGGIYVLSAELALIAILALRLIFDFQKYRYVLLCLLFLSLTALLLTRRTDGLITLVILFLAVLIYLFGGSESKRRKSIASASVLLVFFFAIFSANLVVSTASNSRQHSLAYDQVNPATSNQHAIWLAIYTGLGWNDGRITINKLGLAWNDTFVGDQMKKLSALPKYQKMTEADIARGEVLGLVKKNPVGVLSLELHKFMQMIWTMRIEMLFLIGALVYRRKSFLKIEALNKRKKQKKQKTRSGLPSDHVVDQFRLPTALVGELTPWKYIAFTSLLLPLFLSPVLLAAPYRYYCGVFSAWLALETFFLLNRQSKN